MRQTGRERQRERERADTRHRVGQAQGRFPEKDGNAQFKQSDTDARRENGDEGKLSPFAGRVRTVSAAERITQGKRRKKISSTPDSLESIGRAFNTPCFVVTQKSSPRNSMEDMIKATKRREPAGSFGYPPERNCSPAWL